MADSPSHDSQDDIDDDGHLLKKPRLEVKNHGRPPAGSLFVNAVEPQASIRQHKIVSAYIAACPPSGGLLINEWKIVCRISQTDTYEISLKVLPCVEDECDYNDTYIELAVGPSVNTSGRLQGMAKTFKISVRSGATIGDLLDDLFENNLNKYQMLRGRGNRAWLCGILQIAINTFHNQDENVTAMTYISQGWDNEFPIRPGDFQAPIRGIWLDHSTWFT